MALENVSVDLVMTRTQRVLTTVINSEVIKKMIVITILGSTSQPETILPSWDHFSYHNPERGRCHPGILLSP